MCLYKLKNLILIICIISFLFFALLGAANIIVRQFVSFSRATRSTRRSQHCTFDFSLKLFEFYCNNFFYYLLEGCAANPISESLVTDLKPRTL